MKRKFTIFLFALALLSACKPENRTTVSQIEEKVITESLRHELKFVGSDTAFDHYELTLFNEGNSLNSFIYDPAIFDPKPGVENELFAGMSSSDTTFFSSKWYNAILYNMDHLEISKNLYLKKGHRLLLRLKWHIKYRKWKKSLGMMYNAEENYTVNFPDK